MEAIHAENEAKAAANKPKEAPKAETKEPEVEEVQEITIDDFAKVNFQVGHVIECKKHPKADRLLVSQVQVGDATRQIVSGIASSYTPEEMVGKQVVLVTNLKPVKLRGELSEGMILAATKKDGTLAVVTVDGHVDSGQEVR